MRLALDPRARRLLRRVPRTTVYSAMELVLLSLLAMQCARLVWTLVTPVGPVGEWKAASALRPTLPPATAGLTSSFDPFFRVNNQPVGPAVVTSLNLKLFGVREDRASNRGSAIIALPDGTQRSFVIGEEIVPGVTLTTVAFDSVTVSRGGTPEQLFLDQSIPAPVAGAPQQGTLTFPSAPGTTPVVQATPAPPPPIQVPPAPSAAGTPETQVQRPTTATRVGQ